MKSLLDRMNEETIEQSAEKYLKRYPEHMQMLESGSLLSKIRVISPWDIHALGFQLDAFQAYRKMCEDEGNITALGTIPNIALDVIAATYGTSPISAVASVQPIDDERGTVYYKQVVAQTTKGGTTTGQTIWDATGAPQTVLNGYSSDQQTVALGTTTAAATAVFTASSSLLPLRPQKVTVIYTQDSNRVGPVTATDDGNGNLVGAPFQLAGGGYATMVGTVNYATGVVDIFFFGFTPVNANTVNIAFEQVYEAATNIPQINFQLASKPVVANLFALKDTVGLEQSYAMRRRFGLIAEDELTKDLVASINSEIFNTLVFNLLASVPSGNQQTFSYTPGVGNAPANTSFLENKQHLKDIISLTEASMVASMNRGSINVMIAGVGAASVLSTLPGWVKLSDGSAMGPHIYGTLDGVVVVRVPLSAVMPSYTILTLYKGAAPFDSSCVWAPYMPLVVTTALPVGTNPLQQQKAAAVWGAAQVLLPNFIGQVTITGAPTLPQTG